MLNSQKKFARAFALAAVFGLAACESPMVPTMDAARLAERNSAEVLCADESLCTTFGETIYRHTDSLGALPPGISDWSLRLVQSGGQITVGSTVQTGGEPALDTRGMYVQFFIDNGNAEPGVGDLRVVLMSTPTGGSMRCEFVDTWPVPATLPSPVNSPCFEASGATTAADFDLKFEGYSTQDLSQTTWNNTGWVPFTANDPRDVFLVQVGIVITTDAGLTLGTPTADPIRVDTLDNEPPPPPDDDDGGNGDGGDDTGDDNGDGDDDIVDTTAPSITFSGNAGTYSILNTVGITCTATDAGTGIATQACPSVNAPAYTLPLGVNTLNATARDIAGNVATATTTFTVTVNSTDLCTLIRQLAPNRATPLCAQLRNGTRAFTNHVRAQRGKQLSTDVADLLTRLAAGL